MPRASNIAQADIARTLRAFRGLGVEAEVQTLHDGTMVVSSPKKRVYAQKDWREIAQQNKVMVAKSRAFPSCVYFIEFAGYIKIGYARDLASRLKRLQISFPHTLAIRGMVAGSKAEEAALHRKFVEHWVRGEWFIFDKEIADFIGENSR